MKTAFVVRQLGWRRFFRLLANLPKFVKLFSRLLKDTRVGLGPKLLVAAALAYLIMPLDLIPDVVLGAGQLDDLFVLLTGLKMFLRLCPPQVVHEHLRAISSGR